MSETRPIGLPQAGPEPVRAAIVRAAQATGVDFNYLLAQAKIESSLNPAARASSSSAVGLYQFTQGTWLQTLDRHGANHGMSWADTAIDNGQVRDPATRAQIMALRFDPNASALMAAELASDNRDLLAGVMGREPDAAELYTAHFLGSAGATKFLTALAADPDQSAAALLPQAAAANQGIFYMAGGAPRSVGGVMELLRGKVNAAMTPDGSVSAPATAGGLQPPAGGPIARQFHAASEAPSSAARLSMTATLQSTFGAASDGAVKAAYARLKAFDL